MDGNDNHTGNDMAGAWRALSAASDLAAEKITLDQAWDLVYITLGTAIRAVQAAVDYQVLEAAEETPEEVLASRPGSCAALVEEAAGRLTRVDLGVYPSIAVAINAVTDARHALRQVPV